MSHSAYFRPRLYILGQNGTLTILRLDRDSTAINWTTTYTSAELAAAADVSGTVTDIEVTDDGQTAFVEFDNSGAYLALRHTAPSWRYYAAGETGNPSQGSVNCITDGKWILKCTAVASGMIYIGTWTSTDKAILNDPMPECLDLSAGKAATASGTATFRNLIYSLQNASGAGPRILLFPVTLELPNSAGAQNCRMEELIMASPSLSGIGQNTTFRFTRMVLDLPAVTAVGNYGLAADLNGSVDEKGGETDYADFNLPALKTIGEHAFKRCRGRGVLTLPSVTAIAQSAFAECDYMEEAILSSEKKSLASIATKAFSAGGAQGSLKRVTLGCAEGFTLSATDVFAKQPLEVVTFTGAVPDITAATAWPDTAANTMVFAIPEGVAAWDAIAAGATPLSEAERKACHAAHPDWPIPFAVVDASVFKTHYAQYIAYAGSDKGVSLTVERDAFFDDTVGVTTDWTPFLDGTYPSGTTATLSATPNASGTFVKWYGDVEREDEANPSITVTLDSDKWLYARIVHPWTIAGGLTTASNGNFTINVSVVNASDRTLQVGADNAEGGFFAASNAGTGVLDLGGDFRLEGDSESWRVVQLSNGTKAWSLADAAERGIKGFLSPGTLLRCSTGNWSQSLNGSAYRLVILDEPEAAWWMRDWWLTSGTLEILILRLPHLVNLDYNYILWTKAVGKSSFSWWDLGGVTKIHNDAFAWSSSQSETHILCRGHLALPSMRDVHAKELSRLKNMEGLTLGGCDKATTVTNIAANAFSGDTSLKRLVLHADAGIVVGATPFSNGRTPDEIVFTGAPPRNATVFANLFAGISAGGAPSIARIPIGTAAWMSTSYIDYAPTAAEKALAGDEAGHVFGVFRGEDGGASFVKALCVMDRAPAALVITVR